LEKCKNRIVVKIAPLDLVFDFQTFLDVNNLLENTRKIISSDESKIKLIEGCKSLFNR